MKKILIVSLSIFILLSFNFTQLSNNNLTSKAKITINLKISNNSDTWMKYISKFNNIERGLSVQQTNDNGYIICGYYKKDLASTYIMWLIKTDENGDLEWSKEYEDIHGIFAQQTTDSGFIIVDSFDFSLIKTDEYGNILWKSTFGEGMDRAKFGCQTKDDGYIITGQYRRDNRMDIWVIKTDENGDLEWQEIIDTEGEGLGRFVSQTKDDGYIIIGQKGWLNIWLIKLSSKGIVEWNKTFAGDSGYPVEASSVQQTEDNGYIIFGKKSGYGPDTDIWLIKTDNNGNMIWDTTFGDINHDEVCNSGQQTDDNGFIMIGSSVDQSYSNKDIILIKTKEDGNLEWSKIFGGSFFDFGNFVQQTQDGGYILTGVTDTGLPGPEVDEDLLLIKTDEFGEFIISPKYPYKTEGSTKCKPGNEYTYITKSLNWADKKMKFGWDWDDDEIVDEWTEKYYNSSEDCFNKHTWEKEGTYTIKVIAEDEDGVRSEWSESLVISVSKNKVKSHTGNRFLSTFLEKHPLIFLIFQQINLD